MAPIRENKGFHPLLERERKYLFIDACVQIWPDADVAVAHRHGVIAYGVTAWRPFASTVEALDAVIDWHRVARENQHLVLASEANDIREAQALGRTALVLSAQGGEFLGDNKVRRVEAFYRLGLRVMLPAYNRNNLICSGCLDWGNVGLSAFGRRVVEEANRVSLLLDCTHVSERASLDIIEHSTVPVTFSHSNPKAKVDNPRNITDEQILACATQGGVIGLVSWGPLVMPPDRPGWPTVAMFADHIDHVADLLGSTTQIGLATDMSPGTYPYHGHGPWGEPVYVSVSAAYDQAVTADTRSPQRALQDFNSYPEVYNLVEELERRGYDDTAIRGILGENCLRLYEQVWVPLGFGPAKEAA